MGHSSCASIISKPFSKFETDNRRSSRNGVDAGVLTLPVAKAVSSETSTGQDAKLVLDFKSPQILQSLNTGAFNDFFNVITNTADVTFNLHGAANVSARTNAGTIPITGIPFDVTTDLLGLQSLNARPTVVSNLDVYHGYPTFLQINGEKFSLRVLLPC